MNQLTVSESFSVADRGSAVFLRVDPAPMQLGSRHRVKVTKPDGESFEAIAVVEYARKVPPGEVMALRFPTVDLRDLIPGTQLSFLAAVTSE